MVEWSADEKEFVYARSLEGRYQHPEGHNACGKPWYRLLVEAVNNEFHDGENVRTENAVRMKVKEKRIVNL